MTTFFNILALLFLLVFSLISPCLFLERWLLHTNISTRQVFFSVFLQDYHEGRPHARLLMWLPILALAIALSQLLLLYLPSWPFADMTLFGRYDFLYFIACSLLANILFSTIIWLGQAPEAATIFVQWLTASCNQLLLLALILANVFLLNGQATIDGLTTAQNQDLLKNLPAWNIFLLPLPFITAIWLLLSLYHQRQQGPKTAISTSNMLENHSSFERLVLEAATNFEGLSWTLLVVVLFLGSYGAPAALASILPQHPLAQLVFNTLSLLIKFFLLLLLLKWCYRRYIQQTLLTDTRLTCKILLPANLLQLVTVVIGRYWVSQPYFLPLAALVLWLLVAAVLWSKR